MLPEAHLGEPGPEDLHQLRRREELAVRHRPVPHRRSPPRSSRSPTSTTSGGARTPASRRHCRRPKRLILIPVASDEAMAQLHIANSIDYGNPLQPGTFVGAQARNPKLQSWSATGPVWGAPDGCGYNFIFNNMKAPWNDVNIRLAINYAINRQQISDIGYEGANYPEIIPFSAYMAPKWAPRPRSRPSSTSTTAARRRRPRSTSTWARPATPRTQTASGRRTASSSRCRSTGRRSSGRSRRRSLSSSTTRASMPRRSSIEKWDAKFTVGNHDTLFLVHCGSLSEPYDTLKDLHSKNSQAHRRGDLERHRRDALRQPGHGRDPRQDGGHPGRRRRRTPST